MSDIKPLVFLELFDLHRLPAREALAQRLSELAWSGLSPKKRYAVIASQFVAQHQWVRDIHEFDAEEQIRQLILTTRGDLGGLDYCEVGPALRKDIIHLNS